MKKTYIILLLFITASLNAQNASEILLKTIESCKGINNGYYEMDFSMKYLTSSDTILRPYSCYFKKLKKDPCFPVIFHNKSFQESDLTSISIYNKNYLIDAYFRDSIGQKKSTEKWTKDIQSISHNYNFYEPFTTLKAEPLPTSKEVNKEQFEVFLLNNEKINNHNCYHVKLILKDKFLRKGNIEHLKNEYDFWINKKDHLPVQYSSEIKVVMNNDTMVQYQLYELKDYNINTTLDDALFTSSAIPKYIKLKDYKPYSPPELLPVDTIAPNWKHLSLKGDSITLEDLKGNIVILDFFYKSCYPCMLALPDLQWLHEKYYDRGIRVIGMDPIDDQKDSLSVFLAARGVSYPVVYSNRELASNYRVSGYPTLYVLDRNGKIIHRKKGYSKKMKKELKQIIENNL